MLTSLCAVFFFSWSLSITSSILTVNKLSPSSKRRKKILVMTVDSRDIHEDVNSASYVSMTAVLNYNYARRHDYEYRFFHPFVDVVRVESKYSVAAPKNSSLRNHGSVVGVTAFHPTLKCFRGASWSKLPVLWHVASTHQQFDWILYIDSDIAVTANHGNRSIQDAILFWAEHQVVIWGERNVSNAAIIFMPDDQSSAFGSSEAGDGVFLFRPKATTAKMFKEWWDYDSAESSFSPPYEQAALRKILSSSNSYSLNKDVTAMVAEPQYPTNGMNIDDWCLKSGWICHLGNHWAKDRHRICRRMLHTEFKEDAAMNIHTSFNPKLRRRLSSASTGTAVAEMQLSGKQSSPSLTIGTSTLASTSNDVKPMHPGNKLPRVAKGLGTITHNERTPHFSPYMVQQFRTVIQHIKKNVVQFDVVAAAEQMARINPGINPGIVSLVVDSSKRAANNETLLSPGT
jgi:hypothetical protein